MESSVRNSRNSRNMQQPPQPPPKSNTKYIVAAIVGICLLVLILIIIGVIPTPLTNKSVDCVGDWEPCSTLTTCGSGTSKYKIKTQKQGDGTSCPVADGAFKPCKIKDCPVDVNQDVDVNVNVNCVGEWEPCSVSCGTGTKRYRVRTLKQYNGQSCPYTNNDSRTCKIKDCPLPITPTTGFNISSFTDTDKNLYDIYIFKEPKTYTFNFPYNVECDILVVGGGGSGGVRDSGGGGAGGVVFKQKYSIQPNTNISISVGKGGDYIIPGQVSNDGADSSITIGTTTFSGLGGGGGGGSTGNGLMYNGKSGGSGGGASYERSPGTGLQSTSTSGGSGNDGGARGSSYAGGGGGGAGSAGKGGGDDLTGSIGGDGINMSATFGTNVGDQGWFAGGGGSSGGESGSYGNGGIGKFGGGSKGDPVTAEDALPNTGGGGGSARSAGSTKSGGGGSGVVILRYKTNV